MNKGSKNTVDMANPSARRSQRRISKLLDKNISQYQIPNPYRNSKAHPQLPKNLSRQLSKLDYFSIRVLQNLRFKEPTAQNQLNQLLLKMRSAVRKQTQQFDIFIEAQTMKHKKHSIATNCSQAGKSQEEQQEFLNQEHHLEDIQNEIELEDLDKYQRNLPLVFEPSEANSVVSLHNEQGKIQFFFQRHQHVEQQIQLYYS